MMVDGRKHKEELNKLLQPIFEYMQKELHPHCTLMVTPLYGELVEGICGLTAYEIFD